MITNSAASLFFAIVGFCAIYHNAHLGALSLMFRNTRVTTCGFTSLVRYNLIKFDRINKTIVAT